MFNRTVLLGRRKLMILLGLAVAGLMLLAISPLVIGVTMMKIEEYKSGVVQNEANSVWGVLPWLTMGALAVFGPYIKLLVWLIALAILHDLFVIFNKPRTHR